MGKPNLLTLSVRYAVILVDERSQVKGWTLSEQGSRGYSQYRGIVGMNTVLVWFIIGLVLTIMEFFVPGVTLIFFGISAWIVALTTAIGLTGTSTSQLKLMESFICKSSIPSKPATA